MKDEEQEEPLDLKESQKMVSLHLKYLAEGTSSEQRCIEDVGVGQGLKEQWSLKLG